MYALCLLVFREHPNRWGQPARPFDQWLGHTRQLTRSVTGDAACIQLSGSWWCRYLKSKETLRVKQPKLAVAFRFLPVHVPRYGTWESMVAERCPSPSLRRQPDCACRE